MFNIYAKIVKDEEQRAIDIEIGKNVHSFVISVGIIFCLAKFIQWSFLATVQTLFTESARAMPKEYNIFIASAEIVMILFITVSFLIKSREFLKTNSKHKSLKMIQGLYSLMIYSFVLTILLIWNYIIIQLTLNGYCYVIFDNLRISIIMFISSSLCLFAFGLKASNWFHFEKFKESLKKNKNKIK